MEIFFHGDQNQNKHSTSCALSALITINSNLEKILIFTKHSLYVLCEEDVQICVKVLLRKHGTNLKSSKS
jgi:hypothetical protein